MMPAAPQPRSPNGSSATASAPGRPVAFDLKGSMAPLTVLRLRSVDVPLIERQLRVKIAQLPQLFLDAPVLLDLGGLGADGEALPLGELVSALRQCKLVPVAVSNASDGLRARAVDAGLGVLQQTPAPRARDARPDALDSGPEGGPTGVRPAASRSAHAGPVVVNQPVRSGQVVYAQANDLVVLAPVNPGAQVIADGHVHIYAPLRGRAVAGAQGLMGARIFCQKLEAELIAIAGAYVMADEIPADRRGKPAQIFLDGGECRISPL
jgi:septum site-determining protein MinC